MRDPVTIGPHGSRLAGWHYPGSNGALVVMAGGAGVSGGLATDRFADRFHAAGFHVLAFDYRGFGQSEGTARGVISVRQQLADWAAALVFGRCLPGVDQDRVAIWGSSLSGGHVLRVAAHDHAIAAVVAQNPLTDGPAALLNALRYETFDVAARFPMIAALDAARALLRLPPILVPTAGPPGTVAMLTTPDAQQAGQALDPGHRSPEAFEPVAARSVLRLALYRPGRAAAQIRCPLLVVVAENDQSVLAHPAIASARKAQAQLLRLPGGHYAAYLSEHQTTVDHELDFLHQNLFPSVRRHARPRDERPQPPPDPNPPEGMT